MTVPHDTVSPVGQLQFLHAGFRLLLDGLREPLARTRSQDTGQWYRTKAVINGPNQLGISDITPCCFCGRLRLELWLCGTVSRSMGNLHPDALIIAARNMPR